MLALHWNLFVYLFVYLPMIITEGKYHQKRSIFSKCEKTVIPENNDYLLLKERGRKIIIMKKYASFTNLQHFQLASNLDDEGNDALVSKGFVSWPQVSLSQL